MWQPPKCGWFKLNFEEASKGNPSQANISYCLHNYEGMEVARMEKLIGIETNNMAELTTLVEGLATCIEKGVVKLAIEGDSTIVINALRKGSMPNWRLDAILRRVLNLGQSFKKIH